MAGYLDRRQQMTRGKLIIAILLLWRSGNGASAENRTG